MKSNMTSDWNVRRTENGVIDIRHYAQKANEERRMMRIGTMRKCALLTKGVLALIAGFVTFWNVPPLGPGDTPYR